MSQNQLLEIISPLYMKQKHNRKKEKYTRIACENIVYEWLQLGNLFSLYRMCVCVCFSSCFLMNDFHYSSH